MAAKANPAVEEADVEELAAEAGIPLGADAAIEAEDEDDEEEEAPAEDETDEEEPAAETEAEPTSRSEQKSRRAGKKPAVTGKVNLDEIPEFREWKSKTDQRIAEAEKRAAEVERQQREREQQALQAQLTEMQQRFNTTVDPDERMALIDNMARAKAFAERRQIDAWVDHVRRREKEEGLEQGTIDPLKYAGEVGAVQFERDLLVATNKGLKKKLEETARTTSPEAIAELVKKQVAAALQGEGLNTVDTGELAGPAQRSSREADWRKVQHNKMTAEDYLKRWGKA